MSVLLIEDRKSEKRAEHISVVAFHDDRRREQDRPCSCIRISLQTLPEAHRGFLLGLFSMVIVKVSEVRKRFCNAGIGSVAMDEIASRWSIGIGIDDTAFS